MPDVVLPVNPATLPSGVCPATYQDLLNLFSANQSVTMPGMFVNFIASVTKPGPEFQGNTAWQQLDSLGRPGNIYFFAQGSWLSKHPMVPGSVIWYFQPMDATSILTFDGGDNQVLSPYTGQMWQFATIDGSAGGTRIAAQFPITAGTLASGKILNLSDVGGNETHVQDITEMPPHTHTMQFFTDPQSGNSTDCLVDPNDKGNSPGQVTLTSDSTGGQGSPAVAKAMDLMNPYVVGYMLQRTTRQFYRIDA